MRSDERAVFYYEKDQKNYDIASITLAVERYIGYFTLASIVVVLSEHLARPGIRTPDLPALRPKVLSIRPPRLSLAVECFSSFPKLPR